MLTEDEKNLLTEIIFSGMFNGGNPPTAEYLVSERQKSDEEVRAMIAEYKAKSLIDVEAAIVNHQRALDWLNERRSVLIGE